MSTFNINLTALKQAGNHRTEELERLCQMIDALAKLVIQAYPDRPSEIIELPVAFNDVDFFYEPRGQYRFRFCWWRNGSSQNWHTLSNKSKPTEALLFLATHLKQGWLTRLIQQLDGEGKVFASAAKELEAVCS